MHIWEYGWTRIPIFFISMLLPILLLFPLFLMKALGAGDIKLFSVIGCFYGFKFCLKSIVVAFLIAGVISIIHLIKYKQVFYRFHHFFTYIKSAIFLISTRDKINKLPAYYDVKRDGYEGVIHFSIAILLSVIFLSIYPI